MFSTLKCLLGAGQNSSATPESGYLGLDRICERIYSDEFFVSFVAFCVFLIRFRVPVGSGQNHARYPVCLFHLKPVHKTFLHQANEGNEEFCPAPLTHPGSLLLQLLLFFRQCSMPAHVSLTMPNQKRPTAILANVDTMLPELEAICCATRLLYS
jgi:hypothetical protein